MVKKVILVIDDDEHVTKVIKEALESFGEYKVHAANNGKDGIRKAQRAKPDMVILDIDMPGMNGFAVLEALKEDPKTFSVPVVMLSGQSGEDYKVSASSLYCEDYLTKPISVSELESRISSILERLGY
jgi:CheY-like chemotaxis protein